MSAPLLSPRTITDTIIENKDCLKAEQAFEELSMDIMVLVLGGIRTHNPDKFQKLFKIFEEKVINSLNNSNGDQTAEARTANFFLDFIKRES